MSKRVRSVLFVTTSFPRFCGDFAGSFVFRFAKYLVSDGVQVTVLAPRNSLRVPNYRRFRRCADLSLSLLLSSETAASGLR